MIYYVCKYTPLELMAGFGEACVQLEPSGGQYEQADGLGHPNLCGYGKGILEAAMDPKVSRLILINCCDVMRRVYDILKQNKEMEFLYLLDLPHKNGVREISLLTERLKRLRKTFEETTGIPFYQDAMMNAWKKHKGNVEPEADYLILKGAHAGAFLVDQIRDRFPVPVLDDTCSGNRYLEFTKICENIMEDYGKALLTQKPCMRMLDVKTRFHKERQKKTLKGVLYHTMKFCDYYNFEYATLKALPGIPLLKFETDATRQSEGQLSTRLEAFKENLQLRQHEERKMGSGKYVAGIDSGSTSTDVVILSPEKKLVAWAIVPTGVGALAGAKKALEEALQKAGLTQKDLKTTVSTGYGRDHIGVGNSSVTEITCHARGAHFLDPDIRTIIDIGGQDSKVIRIDETGAVKNFVMNDKCAAGTGRFMEMMARTLDLSLDEMSRLGQTWKEEVQISSMCTVFAESEVVSLIAKNTPASDIIHGLNLAVATKTASLVKRVGGEEAYMMTGGVARNRGVVEALETKLSTRIHVSQYAQLCGAIGAALLALEEG